MSQELIGIIVAAIVLAGIIVTGQWALRRDMADLRKDIAALGERVVLRVIPGILLVVMCLPVPPLAAQVFLGVPESANAWSYIPQIVDGGGWQTVITLANPNLEPATGSIRFRGGDGKQLYLDFERNGKWDGIDFEIPRAGSVEYTSSATETDTAVGWATLVASHLIQAVATYSLMGANGNPIYSVSVPAAPPALQYFSAATPELGIGIANIYESEIGISVIAVPNEGSSFGGNLELPPNGHTAKLLSEIIPELPDSFRGSVLLRGQKPTHYFSAVILNGNGGVYSSLPGAAPVRPVSHRHVIYNTFRRVLSFAWPIEDPDSVELDINSEKVLNASATRDGIQINLALAELLGDSESELAFVIGHEIGHVYQFRSGKQDWNGNRELDADIWGLYFTLLAGYDPYAAAGALAKLEMAAGRSGLDSQYLQDITSAHRSFNTRLDHIYDEIQAFCETVAEDDGTDVCENLRRIFRPHVPGKLLDASPLKR